MEKLINNKIVIGVMGILLILVFVYLYKQPQKISEVENNSKISQFISELPQGDVEPEKCKQLVSDMRGITGVYLVDSKYIYSKKLCLANLDLLSGGTYPNVSSTIQIFDLGSNEIFAESYEAGAVNKDGNSEVEKLFLWGKEEKKPFISIVDLWYKIREEF